MNIKTIKISSRYIYISARDGAGITTRKVYSDIKSQRQPSCKVLLRDLTNIISHFPPSCSLTFPLTRTIYHPSFTTYLFPKPLLLLLLLLCSISSPVLASLFKNYLPILHSHLHFGLFLFTHTTDRLSSSDGSRYTDQATAFDSRKMQQVMSSPQGPDRLWHPPNLLFDGHRC